MPSAPATKKNARSAPSGPDVSAGGPPSDNPGAIGSRAVVRPSAPIRVCQKAVTRRAAPLPDHVQHAVRRPRRSRPRRSSSRLPFETGVHCPGGPATAAQRPASAASAAAASAERLLTQPRSYGPRRRAVSAVPFRPASRRVDRRAPPGSRRRGRTLSHVQARGILVGAPAQEARAVAEAVALHLVVAHLADELGPHGRLLELARPPPVRLREAPLGSLLEQRQETLGDVGVPARGNGRRADVVELAVVAVDAEQERGDPIRPRLPAQRRRRRSRRVFSGFTFTTASREPARYGLSVRLATTPSSPAASKWSSQRERRVAIGRGRREGEALARALELAPPLGERQPPELLSFPEQDVEGDEACAGSPPRASERGSRPGAASSAWRRSRARRHARSRSRRRAPSAAAAASPSSRSSGK